MMVHVGDADGMVSGATHTTASTVRPAMQVGGEGRVGEGRSGEIEGGTRSKREGDVCPPTTQGNRGAVEGRKVGEEAGRHGDKAVRQIHPCCCRHQPHWTAHHLPCRCSRATGRVCRPSSSCASRTASSSMVRRDTAGRASAEGAQGKGLSHRGGAAPQRENWSSVFETRDVFPWRLTLPASPPLPPLPSPPRSAYPARFTLTPSPSPPLPSSGDCAVNMNPNSEELAQIAIVSADTAKAFGVEPRVAMLSYSTLGSGEGPDVSAGEGVGAIVREGGMGEARVSGGEKGGQQA